MKTNAAGVDMIKRHELLRTDAYLCPAGIPTIGYGHTTGVKMGDRITPERAEELLRVDLSVAEAAVDSTCPGLNENQFAALVSFTFNVGVANFTRSTLAQCVRRGDFAAAANEFGRWNHAMVAGKMTVLPGLTRRRAEERALFLTPVKA